MVRVFWVLALTAMAVGAAGWWFDWDFSNSFNITKHWQDSTQQPVQQVNDFINKAINKQKETALSTVEETKQSLVSQAQEQAAAVLDSVEKTLGINKDDAKKDEIIVSPVNSQFVLVIAARADEPVDFLLKNKDRPGSYSVNWGDGQQDRGQLSPNEEKLISHSWHSVGDYIIKFGQQEFLVRIIK